MTREEKEEFKKDIERGAIKAGKVFLERAFYEKVITKKEWREWNKLGIHYTDVGSLFQGYFGRKDSEIKDDKVIILTMEFSQIYKHKDMLQKRLNLKIMGPKECMIEMAKEDKSTFTAFVENQKKKGKSTKYLDQIIKEVEKQ